MHTRSNRGELPYIDSPFQMPEIWNQGGDCLFLDSDEATQEQLGFIAKVKKYRDLKSGVVSQDHTPNPYEFRTHEEVIPYETELNVPKKFQHVDLDRLTAAQTQVEELLAILKKVTLGRRCTSARPPPRWSEGSTLNGFRSSLARLNGENTRRK